MKIQCDVCSKEEASVFCSADEAALCLQCDHRVHLANKLASKHQRFSLLNPINKDAPLCDICQERRAFLFCREDRAILCRECDIPIHTANEHTRRHNRFLLTGVKLSSSTLSSSSEACVASSVESRMMNNSHPLKKKNMVVSVSTAPPSIESTTSTPTPSKGSAFDGGGGFSGHSRTSGGGSTSSIAEYLIETLPGWHVEDLLDSSSAQPHGFCKNDNVSAFLNAGVENDLGNFDRDVLGIWVPQAPPPPHQFYPIGEQQNWVPQAPPQTQTNDMNIPNSIPMMNNRWDDHGYAVPQISPLSNERNRPFW